VSTERLLDVFCELVRIDSPSRAEGALAQRCAELLRDTGFSVEFDDTTEVTGSDTGNLIARLPGTRADAPALLLSAHLDCVQPCEGVEPEVQDGVIRSQGETVLGADDKAGIAAILEGSLRAIDQGAPGAISWSRSLSRRRLGSAE
jgi:tripeptide aminopeptidase